MSAAERATALAEQEAATEVGRAVFAENVATEPRWVAALGFTAFHLHHRYASRPDFMASALAAAVDAFHDLNRAATATHAGR